MIEMQICLVFIVVSVPIYVVLLKKKKTKMRVIVMKFEGIATWLLKGSFAAIYSHVELHLQPQLARVSAIKIKHDFDGIFSPFTLLQLKFRRADATS